jgi:hypothetical protein
MKIVIKLLNKNGTQHTVFLYSTFQSADVWNDGMISVEYGLMNFNSYTQILDRQ